MSIVAAPSPRNSWKLQNYILVYARSSLAEQTTPAYVGIIDSDMPVNDVFWVGEAGHVASSARSPKPEPASKDLDINDLQGTLQWTPPENISGEVITQPDFNFFACFFLPAHFRLCVCMT